MASIKSFTEIVNSMLERLRLVQPTLDTKPGTVSRDLFVDLQADEIQKIYRLIALISDKQSFATASGRDLDRLASNFGVTRRTGTPAGGIAIITTNNLNEDLTIPSGTILTARNGVSFKTLGTFSMIASNKNRYASNAAMDNPQIRNRIEDFAMVIQAVLEARKRVMMDMNVAQENLESVINCLPSMRTPTVSPLSNSDWVAVRAAISRNQLAEIIPQLKSAGACDIVTTAAEQLIS